MIVSYCQILLSIHLLYSKLHVIPKQKYTEYLQQYNIQIIQMVRNTKISEVTKTINKKYPVRNSKKLKIFIDPQLSYQEKNMILKQKNRQSAQRSRDNKKKYIQGLELKIQQLYQQNQYLKNQIRNCKCVKNIQQTNNHSTTEPQQISQNKKLLQDDDIYQRISIKSYTSCSNFLMLAVITVFCIFGFIDINKQNSIIPSSLYNIKNIQSAITQFNFPQCLIIFQENKKESVNQIGQISFKMQKFQKFQKQKVKQNKNAIYSRLKCEQLEIKTIQKMIRERRIKNLTYNFTKSKII